jgi:hypothetical protein
MKVSKRRTSFAERYCVGSKPFTSPAIWDVYAAGRSG